MKFITTWQVRPGRLADAANRFLSTGDPKPKGIESLGRWFKSDLQGGFHLIEADSAASIAEYSASWADLLDIQNSPVIEDIEAVKVMSQIAGVNIQVGAAAARST